MKITILSDNPTSWIISYAEQLKNTLVERGHEVVLWHQASEISPGQCAFFLGCEKIISKEILARNEHNLVIHESALPQGKGWSPLTWQILEGKNDIPITLFEAAEKVDSGRIYLQDTMHFEGHELIDELRDAQGNRTIELALRFVESYPPKEGREQEGEETFYSRRTSKDSELDVRTSIAEQFNLLRVVDNDRYPAFFEYRGYKYIIKIEKFSEDNT
ncbi:MAG: hypothetical protein UX17_C0077G0003 [Parcubacteria group bacterium GW2011_GWC2_45_7]|nr:MAG: hypothetical protein UX17_C0077G0003 [Parcubacteria group bacterium GW2011_GWC2_45_7]KKU74160.1 MAG: hypothetical protein UX98_C0001G0090 [Parcubacteria group bacterium GW2011_GWA2_47_26]